MKRWRISFINEIANICEALGADVKEVARGMRCSPSERVVHSAAHAIQIRAPVYELRVYDLRRNETRRPNDLARMPHGHHRAKVHEFGSALPCATNVAHVEVSIH